MADIAINPVTRRVQFTGNTGTGPFAFTFNILQTSDITVYKNNVLQTLTTDYTVATNANGTGSVTLVTALVATDVLVIVGGRELSRTTDFVTGGDLLASSMNEQLDSNVIMSQQLDERVSRALRSQPGDELTDLYIPLKADRADKLLSFDTEGNVQAQKASDLLAGSVLGANYTKASYTGNGTQTAYSTSVSAGSKNNIQVYIDGVYQNKDTFSISGTTLTFTEAPPLNSAIEFIVGNAITSVTGDASGMTYSQGGTGDVERTVQSKLQEFVSVKDFGAVGDGVTDDAAAIQAAILATYGRKLFFPAGTYIIKSQYGGLVAGEIVAGGNIYWEGETADTTLKFDPASNTEGMFGFDLAANTREVNIKNLTFDLNNKGSSALELQNASTSMADANLADVLLENVTVKNARMYTTSIGAYVVYCRGGFRSIKILNSTFTDLTIDTGLTAGHVGGAHVVVEPEPNDPDNRYAQNVSVERCFFSNVKCDDASYQNDMDGIRVFAPLPSEFGNTELVASSLIVQDSVFVDCWTRSIKSKMQLNSVEGCTFKMSSAPTGGSVSAHVDFQHNGGVIENCKVYNNGVSKPTIFNATINTSTEDSLMGMMCTNNQVYHTGSNSIDYPFATYGNAAGVMGAVIKNNTVIADVTALLNFNWQGTTANFVCSDNTVKSLSSAMARVTGNGGT